MESLRHALGEQTQCQGFDQPELGDAEASDKEESCYKDKEPMYCSSRLGLVGHGLK
jgi:hypothetical protein